MSTMVKIGDYKDIYNQMGGNKFCVMTGSKVKYYGYDNNGYVYLMFELTRNKAGAKFLKVQYNWKDLYDMEFSKVKKTLNKEYSIVGVKIYDEEIVNVVAFEDVNAEDLQRVFREVTGLETKLF